MVETRTENIIIRVTPREKEKMQKLADKECLTLSNYIRRKILKK